MKYGGFRQAFPRENKNVELGMFFSPKRRRRPRWWRRGGGTKHGRWSSLGLLLPPTNNPSNSVPDQNAVGVFWLRPRPRLLFGNESLSPPPPFLRWDMKQTGNWDEKNSKEDVEERPHWSDLGVGSLQVLERHRINQAEGSPGEKCHAP